MGFRDDVIGRTDGRTGTRPLLYDAASMTGGEVMIY